MALSLFNLGQLQSAHNHVNDALHSYGLDHQRTELPLFGWDAGVLLYCYDAHALILLGFPELAEQAAQNAISLVKKLASPFNEALCYGLLTHYYSYRQDATKSLELADAALKISKDGGFLHWMALGMINEGWSLSMLGKVADGLSHLLDGLKAWKSTGAEMAVPTFQLRLGEVYAAAGKFDEGLAAVSDGLAFAVRNNDCSYDAALHRLKGELLLRKSKRNSTGTSREAETCFRRAIEVARKQKARSLELRAAIRLARLWQTMGKAREASHMLKTIYGWFTEGFDTPDLKEAKRLLDELS
jgi:tetratricopeptide (TPR) repeat protein